MRICFLRSCMLGALAIVASAFFASAPVYADVSADPGFYRAVHDSIVVVIDAIDVAPTSVVVATDRRDLGLRPVDVTAAEPLKREFAESYATNGLVFLKPPMRC
ncbi:hypothetical protein ASE04_27495 [Rhizobium sp. Root708]|uniref:hypothetical protein n=1 Tax=Rhizobium sp. Root708 TaxID=1736592 RepID=UPI0006FAF61A|nr:hypothetical protein [Rhizobium sp. Root708]KRB58461.1 hypothetical protein ASE04_27495 [Rhizobium sp. Root708]